MSEYYYGAEYQQAVAALTAAAEDQFTANPDLIRTPASMSDREDLCLALPVKGYDGSEGLRPVSLYRILQADGSFAYQAWTYSSTDPRNIEVTDWRDSVAKGRLNNAPLQDVNADEVRRVTAELTAAYAYNPDTHVIVRGYREGKLVKQGVLGGLATIGVAFVKWAHGDNLPMYWD